MWYQEEHPQLSEWQLKYLMFLAVYLYETRFSSYTSAKIKYNRLTTTADILCLY